MESDAGSKANNHFEVDREQLSQSENTRVGLRDETGDGTNSNSDPRVECKAFVFVDNSDGEHCSASHSSNKEYIHSLKEQIRQLEKREMDLEEQGRQNEEKCMHVVATKIHEIDKSNRELEESKILLEERNRSVQDLTDKVEAQERLLLNREEVIKQLKGMKDIQGSADAAMFELHEQLAVMTSKITQLTEDCEKKQKQVYSLERQLVDKDDLLAFKQKAVDILKLEDEVKEEVIYKLRQEKDVLSKRVKQQELDHQKTVCLMQEQMHLRQKAMAVELEDMRKVCRESEHSLKDELEEKTRIVQSKDEAISVLKAALQEQALQVPR